MPSLDNSLSRMGSRRGHEADIGVTAVLESASLRRRLRLDCRKDELQFDARFFIAGVEVTRL